jgi:hypothetical protein
VKFVEWGATTAIAIAAATTHEGGQLQQKIDIAALTHSEQQNLIVLSLVFVIGNNF